MADQKLTALTEDTTPASTEVMYEVKDPAGTPLDRKVTIANILAVYDDTTATQTNKTIALGSNTVSGTAAEFDTACTDDNFAFVSDNLSVFAATTSAQLAGVISDETGSGALVFATSPTFTTSVILPDNVKALFGTGSDASIYYDGTDLNIVADEVGSGIIKLTQDGFSVSPPTLTADDIMALLGVQNTFTGGNQIMENTGSQMILLLSRPETVADGTTIANIQYRADNDASTNMVFADQLGVMESDVAGSENGSYSLRVETGGTRLTYLKATGVGSQLQIPSDTIKLMFGAGQDASIYYDGTDLIIDANEVGSGVVRFEGTMGNSALDPTTDAPADWVQIKIGATTYYLPAYAAA